MTNNQKSDQNNPNTNSNENYRDEVVYFAKEWRPLRTMIHCALSTVLSFTKAVREESHHLKHDVIVPLYYESKEKTNNFIKITENMTREYPALLIGAVGLLFASIGKKYRFRKFVLGGVVCTAICYPNHAVRLFTAPYEYVKDLQSNNERNNENNNEKKDGL